MLPGIRPGLIQGRKPPAAKKNRYHNIGTGFQYKTAVSIFFRRIPTTRRP